MLRKLIAAQVFFIVLFSLSFNVNANEIRELERKQAIIDQGKDLNKRINRLAAIMVDSIEKRIMAFTTGDWKTYRIKNNKINLLILFNRLGKHNPFNLEEFRDPLRRDVYKRLTNAMGFAIENRRKLLKKIEILHFNIEKLTEMIEGTGKSVINRNDRRELGLLKAENAVYEVFLSTNPKEGNITIGGKIVTIETGNEIAYSGIYKLKARSLFENYHVKEKVSPPIVVKQVIQQNAKVKELNVSKIYYLAPGSQRKSVISNNTTVQSGGKIWFELTLPQPGGYLLAYLRDSNGRAYNLFPGTRNAIINGDYRVPYNLDNPYTEIEKTAADNANAVKLPAQKVLIGGYTFDRQPGMEEFSFYYMDQRNWKLEANIKEAQNIGKDMPRMKGVLTDGVTGFKPDVVMTDPGFYHKELTLRFEHN